MPRPVPPLARRCPSLFNMSVCAILLITAAAKLYAASGKTGILDRSDALLLLSNRNAMLLAALLEVSVCAVLIFARSDFTKAAAVFWMSSCFLAYRVATYLLHVPAPCPCLGNL